MPNPAGLDSAWAEAGPLLGALRAFGVQVRFDPKTYAALWKPKFVNLPVEYQEAIREQGIAVVRCLVPWNQGNGAHRPGWTNESLTACIGCGSGVSLRDPLGQPRHYSCGWTGQAPTIRTLAHTGRAARIRRVGG